MLVHHLTFIQLKKVLLSAAGSIVEVHDGLHPDDVAAAGFTPIIAVTISVEGIGYHYQRLYASQSISLTSFLYEAWSSVHETFGVPDQLVVSGDICSSVDLQGLLSQLSKVTPDIVVRNDRKYAGSKRSAQGFHCTSILHQHFNESSADKIHTDEGLTAWRVRVGEEYNRDRLAIIESLESRKAVKPFRPKKAVTIIAEDWMRDTARRTPVLKSSQRLILIESEPNLDKYVVGFKPFDFASDPRWVMGLLKIFVTQSETLMRCLWSCDYWTYSELAVTLDLDSSDAFREIAWGRVPIDPESFDQIHSYLSDYVSFFSPRRLEDIGHVLDFIDATVLRKAELVTPKQSSRGSRFLVYEVSTETADRLLFFTIDELKILPEHRSLIEFPVIDIPFVNSDSFSSLVHDVRWGKVDENSFLHQLNIELRESDVWASLYQELPLDVSDFIANHQRSLEMASQSSQPNDGLLIAAFQALRRERLAAYKTVETACNLSGMRVPDSLIFGIEEVTLQLLRLGVQPE